MAFVHRSRKASLALLMFVALTALALLIDGQSSLAAAGGDRGGLRPLPGRHLYVVPASGDGRAAIEQAGARVVARYESFSLVSADGAANPVLRSAGADRRDDMRSVAVGDGTLDPAVAPTLHAAGEESLALVQFVGPVKDSWLERIRKTGATVVTYMAQNAYLVHAGPAAGASLSALADDGAVRAVTPFTAAQKTASGIPASGTAKVAVETLAGAAGAAARDLLSAGKRLRPAAAYGGTVTEFAAIDAGRVAELAADPGVVGIEPWTAPKLLDERAAQIVASNLTGGTAPSGPGYLAFLNGEGFPPSLQNVVLDITDEGVDQGVVPVPSGSHPDFFVNGNASGASRLMYAQEATAGDANARDCGGHGTNVASIAAGFNNKAGANFEDAQGFNYGLGISPRARIGATKIFNCAGNFDVQTSFTALRSAAYASGARISQNSWGANVGGAYTADSREFDFLVRDAQPTVNGNQQMTNIFSAGNAGAGPNTIGAPGTAKNVITVGAAENVRAIGATDGCGVTDAGANSAKDIIDFSSRGPTDDGRLKPDVVAPGTHVTGAQPQTGADYNGSGTCNPQFPAGSSIYTLVSGTSQAAPEVSGMATLIRDWFSREVSSGTAPSPAMTKAIMVNTATDEVGGNDGAGGTNASVPTQIQGWGRINLKRILDGTTRQYVDQSSKLGATGQRNRRTYAISSPAKQLKVTLAWTDAPGPTSGNAFVNDLNLVVHAGGHTYKGNVFAAGVSSTGGAADPRNNVENVFLPAGTTGPLTVDVTAANIAGDGVPGNADATDQDYALVVSNAAPANKPVLVGDLSTTTEIGDGDGAIEPGESFRLLERLRNLGSANATGITGVLAPGPRITVPVDSSPYPNIAPNGVGTNSTQFRVHLNDNFVCGDPAALTLDLTTNQGAQHVPISFPTGSTGAPINRNSTDVPKAIPDNGAVVSQLQLTGGGRIDDLNVRIPSLTHTYDGDLIVKLVGPDNTTVVLSNRRGGSGDNYTNTVFDDEAATAIGSGAPPFTGSFRPDQPLAAFDDKTLNGTWKLRVEDAAADDTGTLGHWGVTYRVPSCG
jgi:subtilisin-like proprotein convertase family protein